MIEARIPTHLLYVEGWPTVMPTREEAELLAKVRREIGALLDVAVGCTDADAVIARYAELMAQNAAKASKAKSRGAKKRLKKKGSKKDPCLSG